MKAILQVEVEYDPNEVNIHTVANGLDQCIDGARESGSYESYVGANVQVRSFHPAPARMRVRASDIRKLVDYDPEPDTDYARRMADEEGIKEELEAIERGDLTGYYCKAVVDITIPDNDEMPDYCSDRGITGIVHHIASPGLWSIFAKNDEDPYFDQIFAEERRTVIDMLTKMGIEVENDLVYCRYGDCPDGDLVATGDQQVTCPRCRKTLGLPPLEG